MMTGERRFKKLGGVLCGLLAFPPGFVSPVFAAAAAQLRAVKVSPDSIRVVLSRTPRYKTFVLKKPPRVVLDLFDTRFSGPVRDLPGRGGVLSSVHMAQYRSKPALISRIVMDLKALARPRVFEQDGLLKVALSPAGAAPAAAAAKAPGLPPRFSGATYASTDANAAPQAMSDQYSSQLEGMAQKRSAAAGKSSAPQGAAPGANLAGNQGAGDEAAKLGSWGGMQGGDILSRLPAERVSVDYDNADIRDVLKMLASEAKINIVAGPDVTGRITLHLANVPFKEVLQAVLSIKNLSTSQVGDDILRVVTPEEYKKMQTGATNSTHIIRLNYTKAADLIQELNMVLQAEGRTQAKTSADSRTNSLLVTDTFDGYMEAMRLVKKLDVRPPQVLIEAKIVEVTLTKNFAFGVQWQYYGVNQNAKLTGGGTNLVGTNSGAPAGTQQGMPLTNWSSGVPIPYAPSFPAGTAAGTINTMTQQIPSVPNFPNTGIGQAGNGTGVNLPINPIYGGLELGRITNNYFLNAALLASALDGKLKVLSDPKIATLNNQPANINVVTNIPYETANLSGTGISQQTVTYITTGIQLTVTPTVNKDGRVMLNINPVVSQVSATIPGNSASGAPSIDSRNAQTTVMVRDGETIVLGGLISDTLNTQYAYIPFLGSIPVIGWLFKSKTKTRTRTELLIFVTPKIIPS